MIHRVHGGGSLVYREAALVLRNAELLLLDRDGLVFNEPVREFALARLLLVLLIFGFEVLRWSDKVDHGVLAHCLILALVAAVAPSGLLSDIHIFASSPLR